MKAYQYTSLTSVMLIDCWAIPCVILLTWVFLKTKYGLRKFIGVVICVAGIILVVFSDVHASDRASKNMIPMKVYSTHTIIHLYTSAWHAVICSVSAFYFGAALLCFM